MLRNKKIIILGIVTLFLLVVLIFVFKIKEIENNKKGNEEAIENETATKLFEELKNNHPEFSSSQLEFYRKTSGRNKEILVPCEGRDDENDCIASVSFLKDRVDVCSHIKNEEAKIECANSILREGRAEKIDKCWLLNGDDFIECSRDLFLTYDKPENCLNLKSEKAQQMCESVFYYETAFLQRNRELCKKIRDEKLNQYCFKNTR
jgi:hypothetical protein